MAHDSPMKPFGAMAHHVVVALATTGPVADAGWHATNAKNKAKDKPRKGRRIVATGAAQRNPW